jgi:hypothetical protein
MDLVSNLSLQLSFVIPLCFYLVTALYGIFTFIIYYHWKEYSIDPKVSKITAILYTILTAPLIAALGLLTLSLT